LRAALVEVLFFFGNGGQDFSGLFVKWKLKSGGQNTDNGEWFTIQSYFLSDGVLITIQPVTPKLGADDNDTFRATFFFLDTEVAAERGRDLEHGKEVGSDTHSTNSFGLFTKQRESVGFVTGNTFEGTIL
jgi:hypothetical protein